MHGIRDDAPGYFGDEPPTTMTLVTSEIISVYGTEAVSVVGDLNTIEEESPMDPSNTYNWRN